MDQRKHACKGNVPVRGLVENVDVLYRTGVQTAVCVTLKQIGKGSADLREKTPTQIQHASGSIPHQIPKKRNSTSSTASQTAVNPNSHC